MKKLEDVKKARYRTGLLKNYMVMSNVVNIINISDDEGYLYDWELYKGTERDYLVLHRRYLPRQDINQTHKYSERFKPEWEFEKSITIYYE